MDENNSKDYLILFEGDIRKKTYAKGVHYQIIPSEPIKEINEQGEEIITGYTEEQIIPLISNFDYNSILEKGGQWKSSKEYIDLLKTSSTILK